MKALLAACLFLLAANTVWGEAELGFRWLPTEPGSIPYCESIEGTAG